jgi:hypothetical protein
MAKKSINDPEFFDDDHLDDVGEPVAILDPDGDTPPDAEEATDVVVDDDTGAEDGTDDPDAPADAADADADVEPVADEQGSDDPAPHLEDLDTAKLAYAEVRKWANQRDMQARKLEEKLAALEADLTEFDYEEPAPAYDAREFARTAGEDPRAAFEYALQNGQTSDAQAAIAQVQADAAELASLAAIALKDNDQQSYQQHRMQATNASTLALQLAGRLQNESMTRQQAPLVEAQNRQNVQAAWSTLNQQTNGELAARQAQVRQVLAERPYLVQGTTAEAIYRGYQDALTIASSQPAPAAAPTDSIDDVVKAAVDKHIAATRAAKAKAAGDAQGADSGRTAPTTTVNAGEATKAAIYAEQASASMGARKFMDG